MLNEIKDKVTFKKANKSSWEQNTSFWLSHQLIDTNVKKFLTEKILSLISSTVGKKSLIDLGCGNGWLLDSLIESNTCNYLGIDYNQKFIECLKEKYSNKADFRNLDIEEPFPENLFAKGDIIINCLNLIETPNLENVFKNISFITKHGGIVLIIFLNPIVEIIRDSKDFDEIKSNFDFYRMKGEKIVISKKIISNGDESVAEYYRILYSINDFIKVAIGNDFIITETDHIYGVNNKKNYPPLYEYILLKK